MSVQQYEVTEKLDGSYQWIEDAEDTHKHKLWYLSEDDDARYESLEITSLL